MASNDDFDGKATHLNCIVILNKNTPNRLYCMVWDWFLQVHIQRNHDFLSWMPDIQFTFLFSSVRCLRNHLKTVHLEEKPFKCKFCNCQTSFASEGRLTTHVIRVHSKTVVRLTRFIYGFNPIWHGRGYFYPLVLFGSDFVRWIFFKNFQTFLELKIDINRVILTPCPAHWV